MRQNEKIRKLMRRNDVTFWQLAQSLGVSESTLYRWLNYPLPMEREKMLTDAIVRLGGAET